MPLLEKRIEKPFLLKVRVGFCSSGASEVCLGRDGSLFGITDAEEIDVVWNAYVERNPRSLIIENG